MITVSIASVRDHNLYTHVDIQTRPDQYFQLMKKFIRFRPENTHQVNRMRPTLVQFLGICIDIK